MCGNVIDLAVDVVIGSASTAIVTASTDNLLESLLNTIGGTKVKDLGLEIISGNPSTYLGSTAAIAVAVDFLLVAAVVYFVITVPMNEFDKIREAHLETSAESGITEADLLIKIRDLLVEQDGKPKTEPD